VRIDYNSIDMEPPRNGGAGSATFSSLTAPSKADHTSTAVSNGKQRLTASQGVGINVVGQQKS
jgi:hypothetical protein